MNQVTRATHVHDDHADTSAEHEVTHGGNILSQIALYIGGIISLLLGFRFLLILMGANNTGVVNWFYQVTQPFVSPFYGIFGNTVLYDNARIEWESLVAIVVIAIITYILSGFFRLFR